MISFLAIRGKAILFVRSAFIEPEAFARVAIVEFNRHPHVTFASGKMIDRLVLYSLRTSQQIVEGQPAP